MITCIKYNTFGGLMLYRFDSACNKSQFDSVQANMTVYKQWPFVSSWRHQAQCSDSAVGWINWWKQSLREPCCVNQWSVFKIFMGDQLLSTLVICDYLALHGYAKTSKIESSSRHQHDQHKNFMDLEEMGTEAVKNASKAEVVHTAQVCFRRVW